MSGAEAADVVDWGGVDVGVVVPAEAGEDAGLTGGAGGMVAAGDCVGDVVVGGDDAATAGGVTPPQMTALAVNGLIAFEGVIAV
ncbi:hypothetical protein ACSVHC_17210 [Arthrobacter sp. KNU-44]|uniref:hypothetical protein n=1 Tax=Arthrobacter sp. KNU-44 TaxID=3450744 RepID=UPI003F4216B0